MKRPDEVWGVLPTRDDDDGVCPPEWRACEADIEEYFAEEIVDDPTDRSELTPVLLHSAAVHRQMLSALRESLDVARFDMRDLQEHPWKSESAKAKAIASWEDWIAQLQEAIIAGEALA
jgi:hypothetical protein